MAWINNDRRILLRSPDGVREEGWGGGERQKFTFGVWEQAEPEIVSDSLGLHAACPGAPRPGKMAPSPSCHSSAHSRPGLIKFWSIPLRSVSIPNERLKMGLSAALENKNVHIAKTFFFSSGIKVLWCRVGDCLAAEKDVFCFFSVLCYGSTLRVHRTKRHMSSHAKGGYLAGNATSSSHHAFPDSLHKSPTVSSFQPLCQC